MQVYFFNGILGLSVKSLSSKSIIAIFEPENTLVLIEHNRIVLNKYLINDLLLRIKVYL